MKATLELLILQPEEIASNVRSTMAVLGYALRQRLDIRGIYHPPFMLELPLQVLYCGEGGNIRVA